MKRHFVALLSGLLLCSPCEILAQTPTPSTPSAKPLPQLGKAPVQTTATTTTNAQVQPFSTITLVPSLSVDTSIRRASRNFYNAIYGLSDQATPDWTGDVATGVAGTTSQDFQDAVTLRINVVRAFAGVPAAITLNSTWSGEDQQAALMMSANNQLSHTPPTTWIDYTAAGAQAAGSSDLYLGTDGSTSVTGYIEDPGSNNAEVGHRRWVLYPPTLQMGVGDIPVSAGFSSANALWVIDPGHPYPALRDGFVAWPPKGYIPYPFIFPRWSFSLNGANFSNATVSVTQNGASIGTVIESNNAIGYGDNTLVWHLAGAADGSAPYAEPASDVTYSVTVGNVVVNGTTSSFTYPVIVFDPAMAGTDDILPTLSGPSSVFTGTTTNYSFTTIPEASNYDVLNATLQPVTWVEGAETNPPLHLVTQTTGTYNPINTTTSASGSACFQLCQDSFLNQDLLLTSQFVASATSSISFQARYGYMTTTQIAEVDVSTDDGTSWTPAFSRPGTSSDTGSFSPQSVSLSAYANRIIRIRFLLNYTGGSAYTQTGENNVGWLIDNITPLNMPEVAASTETTITTTPASLVAPNAPTTVALAVRGLLFGAYPLEYGPVTTIRVTTPPTIPAITSPTTATGTFGATFSYQITATNSPASYNATGLPMGLAINQTTGILTGQPTATGTSQITVSATNAAGTGSTVVTLTVGPASQTVSFPAIANKTYDAAPFAVSATASSGLPITFSIVSGPATISGSMVKITGTGTVTVKASQGGNANYTATSTTKSFIVSPAAQVITFPGIVGQLVGGKVTLNATANSGLAVSYMVTGPATLSGSTLTMNATGPVSVTASQAGNTDYTAATAETQSFTVYATVQSQTVTFPAIANMAFTTTPFALKATASSGLPIAYTTSGPVKITGNQATLIGVGTVRIRASQPGDSAFSAATSVLNTFTVTLGSQTISFPAPPAQVYGAKVTLGATASSGLAVSYTLVSGPGSVTGNVLTCTGIGTVVVQASQAGNANYLSATNVTQSFSVTPAAQTITFPAIANRVYPSASFATGATASSGLAVTYTTSGPVKISGNIVTITGTGMISIRAHQDGDTDYAAAATVLRSFTVTAAP